jgi:hypothetical protein
MTIMTIGLRGPSIFSALRIMIKANIAQARAVASAAMTKLPLPQARPMAIAIQIVVAVVKPLTSVPV